MRKIKRTCLIEDDSITVLLIRKMLEKTEAVEETLVYRNGKEAYDNLKLLQETGENLPELIFLDLNMPIWDGWEFLKEFRRLDSFDKLHLYILTSSSSQEDYQKAEEYGLKDRYLSKPITLDSLNRIIQSIEPHLT
jgi:CheY-like chemotaxis protein